MRLFISIAAGWIASRCINRIYVDIDIPRTQQQTPLTLQPTPFRGVDTKLNVR